MRPNCMGCWRDGVKTPCQYNPSIAERHAALEKEVTGLRTEVARLESDNQQLSTSLQNITDEYSAYRAAQQIGFQDADGTGGAVGLQDWVGEVSSRTDGHQRQLRHEDIRDGQLLNHPFMTSHVPAFVTSTTQIATTGPSALWNYTLVPPNDSALPFHPAPRSLPSMPIAPSWEYLATPEGTWGAYLDPMSTTTVSDVGVDCNTFIPRPGTHYNNFNSSVAPLLSNTVAPFANLDSQSGPDLVKDSTTSKHRKITRGPRGS